MPRCLSLLSAALLLLSAAPLARAQSSTPPASAVTVNLLSSGEPDTLDPNRTTFAFVGEAALVRQVFEPLLRLDENLVPRPAAAESYDVSPDGTVYTFHLRPDGRWSDGQPVIASQFAYSWKRILDPALSAEYATFFVNAGIVGADEFHSGKVATADAVGIRALDDATLEIRLNEPFGALPELAALWVVSPLRSDIVSANVDGWAGEAATLIGNGPFMVSEWVHQDHATLVPNPAYVAHGVWPAPALSKITVRMQTNTQADYAAFMNGERDWSLVPDSELNAVQNDPDLSKLARSMGDLTTFWVHLNTGRAPLDNVLVRRALSKAIDRKALVRDLAAGVGVPTTSIVPPGMPGYQEGLGVADLDFDVDAARALLAQAGFADGVGFPSLKFGYPPGPANQRRAEYLTGAWKQVLGINVTLAAMTNADFQQALHEKMYDIAFGGWAADYPDPQDWLGPVFGCGGAFNYAAYCSSELDQLVARGDSATALADRLQYYGQAQTTLVRDAPVIPLYSRARLVIARPWVQLALTPQDEFPGSYLLDRVSVSPH